MAKTIICKSCDTKNVLGMGASVAGKVCKKCGERLDAFCSSCGRSTSEKKGGYATDAKNQFFVCNTCEKVWCSNCMGALVGKSGKSAVLLGKKGKIKCPQCNQGVPVMQLPESVPFSQSARARSAPVVSTKSKEEPTPVQEVIIQEKQVEGEFRQSGVLCLFCKTVTALGNKRCQSCHKKLKVTPLTTVYYNGTREAVQCRKCGKYTDFKDLKCEYCNKKFKF